MQTFLPYSSFYRSAKCLDTSRLNKQIVECQQILNAMVTGAGWANHPAVRMWKDHRGALVLYAESMTTLWARRRGAPDDFSHGSWLKIVEYAKEHGIPLTDQPPMPEWLGDERLHSSHRSRLLLKGLLDTARKRAILFIGTNKAAALRDFLMETFDLPKSRANFRDLTVAQVNHLHTIFSNKGIELHANYYEQFNWDEKPTDDYFWPVPTGA